MTKWITARIRDIMGELSSQARSVFTHVVLTNPKYMIIAFAILLAVIVTIYLYTYWSFTSTHKLPRTTEHFIEFVKFTTGDTSLQHQLKQAEQHESRGEMITRAVLESIFKPHKFPKVRLDYIINPVTNTPLEFDCYCDELKIAVEYNGIQHYKYVPYFHETKQDFYNQKYRDRIKQELCDKYSIRLVTIPYTVSVKELPMFLVSAMSFIQKTTTGDVKVSGAENVVGLDNVDVSHHLA